MRFKTDSFVHESNVHFPTDYNLLWDCIRKCLDMIARLAKRYPGEMTGWRKLKFWRRETKSLMRELGRVSGSGGKQKEERLKTVARKYVSKSQELFSKLMSGIGQLPLKEEFDLATICELERYMKLMVKHIDLAERRLIKGKKIPHAEKMFSIFETYTEWITKGKSRPSVELGKKVAITTDQWNLIVDYQIMNEEQDRDIVIFLANRLLQRHNVSSWSFDKGFWNGENRELLRLFIPNVIMPKLGKLSAKDTELENSRAFKRLKNKHSAIESNINELEHRGLDRCPDRGEEHFKSYVGLGVCAYNLKKTGRAILEAQRQAEKLSRKAAA